MNITVVLFYIFMGAATAWLELTIEAEHPHVLRRALAMGCIWPVSLVITMYFFITALRAEIGE